MQSPFDTLKNVPKTYVRYDCARFTLRRYLDNKCRDPVLLANGTAEPPVDLTSEFKATISISCMRLATWFSQLGLQAPKHLPVWSIYVPKCRHG